MWRTLSLFGPWKWLNLALLLPIPATSFALYWYPQFRPPPRLALDPALAARNLGPWSVSLRTRDPLHAARSIRWTLQLCSGCGAAVQSTELAWGTKEGPTGEPAIAQGSADERVLILPAPDSQPGDVLYLWASAHDAQGVHRAHWTLKPAALR
jgi:hypothetical protein